MFGAPSRGHLARPQRRENEAGPVMGEPRGPLRRAGMPSAAPGLADPGGPERGMCAPVNTVADEEGAYSRQYGGGSSLGAVTSPTSRALQAEEQGRGGARGASSLPLRRAGSARPPPAHPEAGAGRSGLPTLSSAEAGVEGGAQGPSTFPTRPSCLPSHLRPLALEAPLVASGAGGPDLAGLAGLADTETTSGPWS